MPYIKEDRRETLDPYIDQIVEILKCMDAKDGDYNYLITRILASGFDLGKDPKYSKINTVVGVLECIKLELYRRVASEYEDRKSFENEDVKEYKEFEEWIKSTSER